MQWKSEQGPGVNSDAEASSTSVQIVRRLMAREAILESDDGPARPGVALQRACARVSGRLRDAMGDDGCSALFLRALTRTEPRHPALKTVRHLNGNGLSLDGISVSIDAHGIAATTLAIEALLAGLIDVLGRLIGEDMATRLIDHDTSRSTQ